VSGPGPVGPGAGGAPALRIESLGVTVPGPAGPVRVVEDVSLRVAPGETLGLVGESGSGKTMTALAVMGLLPREARRVGTIELGGTRLDTATERDLERIRGRRLAIVFQGSLGVLNPVMRVGDQVAEAIRVGGVTSAAARAARVRDLLDLVGIPDPARWAHRYPHELSGGMRQRVAIAMAIANEPDVLIADEATTALDVTVQAQVLDVLRRIQARTATAILFISHDLGLVAGAAQRVAVMYAGRIVEDGPVDELFAAPHHPYTAGLLAALPRLDGQRPVRARLGAIPGQPARAGQAPAGCPFHPRCAVAKIPDPCATRRPEPAMAGDGRLVACHRAVEIAAGTLDPGPGTGGEPGSMAAPLPARSAPRGPDGEAPLLTVEGLVTTFPVRTGRRRRPAGRIEAVAGVDLHLHRGEALGVVGESGCGKSTLARSVLRLVEPDRGRVLLGGRDVRAAGRVELRRLRQRAQIVFQDPDASLNPRMSVGTIVAEPLRIHGRWDRDGPARVRDLLQRVGLDASALHRYPHELSGGQRQRVAIARALAVGPDLLVLDEPVTALDTSVQAGVLNLLADLQATLGLAYLLIAHDLAVVRHTCDRVAVMFLGRIVETGPVGEVFDRPAHPYTQALRSAVPIPDPPVERARRRIILHGDPPSPLDPPSGCRFRTRCWRADDRCATEVPALADRGGGHPVACHHPGPGPEG